MVMELRHVTLLSNKERQGRDSGKNNELYMKVMVQIESELNCGIILSH